MNENSSLEILCGTVFINVSKTLTCCANIPCKTVCITKYFNINSTNSGGRCAPRFFYDISARPLIGIPKAIFVLCTPTIISYLIPFIFKKRPLHYLSIFTSLASLLFLFVSIYTLVMRNGSTSTIFMSALFLLLGQVVPYFGKLAPLFGRTDGTSNMALKSAVPMEKLKERMDSTFKNPPMFIALSGIRNHDLDDLPVFSWENKVSPIEIDPSKRTVVFPMAFSKFTKGMRRIQSEPDRKIGKRPRAVLFKIDKAIVYVPPNKQHFLGHKWIAVISAIISGFGFGPIFDLLVIFNYDIHFFNVCKKISKKPNYYKRRPIDIDPDFESVFLLKGSAQVNDQLDIYL